MKKIIGLAAVSLALLASSQIKSDLRKAFELHNQNEYPSVKAYYPAMGGESYVLSERWKNYQKYAKECPAIAEVVNVNISKTEDTGEYVIQMSGPSASFNDGGKDVCSLWLTNSTDVRDFTPY